MADLVLVGPDGGEKHHTIPISDQVIGRDPETELHVDDSRISRRHARVGWRLVIEDLGSTNGIFWDGERIQSRVLEGGDQIGLGGGDRYVLEVRGAARLEAEPSSLRAPATGASEEGDAAQERCRRLESQLEAARQRILSLEHELSSALDAAARPAEPPVEEPEPRAAEEPEPSSEPERDEALGTSVAEETEVLRLRRSVLGLTRERDELHEKLRERENRLTVLERDNWRLRTTGSIGDDTQISLRNEVEDLRSALREREQQLAEQAQPDAPPGHESAEPQDVARKLADREARIASLQKELSSMRDALEGKRGAGGARGFVADVASSLLDAKQVAVSTLRPGVDRDLSQLVRSLQRFALGVEHTVLGTARSSGVLEAWGLLAEPGLVQRQGEVVRSGGDDRHEAHQAYLERLAKLIAGAFRAADEAFAVWLDDTWAEIGPGALRKQASLALEGGLDPAAEQALWQRYEEVMRALDADALRERFREHYREEVSRS